MLTFLIVILAAGEESWYLPIATPTSPLYIHLLFSFIISMIFINMPYILYYFYYIFKADFSDLFKKSLIH